MDAVLAKIQELEGKAPVDIDADTQTLLKATEGCPGTETLRGKVLQQAKELAVQRREWESVHGRFTAATTEHEQLTTESKRLGGVKAKLEALCQELQTRNKDLLTQQEAARAEDAEKRKVLTDKFQLLLDGFTKKMETHMAETKVVADENQRLRAELSGTTQQTALEKEAYTALLKQKELELALVSVKFDQETHNSSAYVDQLAKAKADLAVAKAAEAALNERIAEYGAKYDALRVSLADSTSFIDEFKKYRDDMDKRTKTLVTERAALAKRAAGLDKALQAKGAEGVEAVKAQVEKLQSLCRALQVERNDLRRDLAVAMAASSPAPAAE